MPTIQSEPNAANAGVLTRWTWFTPREIFGKTVYFSVRFFQIDEGDTPLIPIRTCFKLMLQLYTQSSTGYRVRPEDKKEAKLMAKAVARQDVMSTKMSVDDLQGMRSGMQFFFRPSPPNSSHLPF
jgi:hypothetical protein